METKVSSSSAAADLLAYGRERIVRWRIAALVLLVAGVAFIVEAPGDAADALTRVALAAVLIVQFRLWDDLADRDYDRVRHPARVVVRSTATQWFWALLAVLAVTAAGAIGMLDGVAGLSIYCGLLVLLAVVYHGPWRSQRFIRSQLVLLKYPVLILLLTTWSRSIWGVLAGAVLYLLLSVYDWHDDPALRESPAGGRLAVVLAAGIVVAVSLASGLN